MMSDDDLEQDRLRWLRGLELLGEWRREHPQADPPLSEWVGRWLEDQRSRSERGLLGDDRRAELSSLGVAIPDVDPAKAAAQRALEDSVTGEAATPEVADDADGVLWHNSLAAVIAAAHAGQEPRRALRAWLDLQLHHWRWGRISEKRAAMLDAAGFSVKRGKKRRAAPAAGEKPRSGEGRTEAPKPSNRRAQARDPAAVTTAELLEAGVPAGIIDSWIAAGRLLETPEPGVWLKTRGLTAEIDRFRNPGA